MRNARVFVSFVCFETGASWVRVEAKLSHATSTEPSFTMEHPQQVSEETSFHHYKIETCTVRTFDNVPARVPSVRKRKFSRRKEKNSNNNTTPKAHKVKIHTETSERSYTMVARASLPTAAEDCARPAPFSVRPRASSNAAVGLLTALRFHSQFVAHYFGLIHLHRLPWRLFIDHSAFAFLLTPGSSRLTALYSSAYLYYSLCSAKCGQNRR